MKKIGLISNNNNNTELQETLKKDLNILKK